MGDVGERLWETLEPYLEAEGVELDDLDVRGRGNGRLVRVTVDAPGGLGVDRIAQLSRGVSRLLDEQDPVSGSYTLEVSSPGLERPLRRPSHFEKSVGREVDVKTVEPIDGAQRHRGVLERIDDSVLGVVVDGAERSIPIDSVTQAKTVFRWEKSPKPGGKRGKR
jgi:ribosome maturation factor RimP